MTQTADAQNSDHESLHKIAIYCAPDRPGITKAAQDFLIHSHDTIHFIATPYRLAQKLDATLDQLGAILKSSGIEMPDVINYSEVLVNYGQTGIELLTSRVVDLFLSYVSDLLSLVFSAHPHMLKSSKTMKYEEILAFDDMDSLISSIAEETVSKLAYEGFASMSRKLKELYDLDLVPDAGDFQTMLAANEFRNLYVHARGVVNRTYLERVPTSPCQIGDTISSAGQGFLPLIAKVVLEIDERARSKFGLTSSSLGPVPRRCLNLGL